jgi:hypothetical protein
MRTRKRREAFLQARESVDQQYKYASELAKLVVEDHIQQMMLQH